MPKTGVELIAEERRRQVEEEGWTAEHDEMHDHDELALAGACYALPEDCAFVTCSGGGKAPRTFDPWPWWRDYWRYTDSPPAKVPVWDKRDKHSRLRRLVIAGALIAAEIDRLQRACNTDPVVENQGGDRRLDSHPQD